MGKDSAIEWCHHTHNSWHGCVRVSPGCQNCYAETLTNRWGGNYWGPAKTSERRIFGEKHWNEPRRWNKAAYEAGERHRVFSLSMGDFAEDHPQLPPERKKLVQLITETPSLIWLLLTKRPENVMPMLNEATHDLYGRSAEAWLEQLGDSVWIGTSVENQEWADKRVPILLQIPAEIRFLSVEPLLGPVELFYPSKALPHGAFGGYPALRQSRGVEWVIVGGESGHHKRPMDLAWARKIRDDCAVAEVPFFFKQIDKIQPIPDDLMVRQFPKVREVA